MATKWIEPLKINYPWNKGIKTGLIPKTAFRKGEHRSPETEFKKGEHASEGTEFKKGERLGKENIAWMGNKAGYTAMHKWIYKTLIKPQVCRDCNQVKELELSNISGRYLRDISDWEWLCKICHRTKDWKTLREGKRIKTAEFFVLEGRKF